MDENGWCMKSNRLFELFIGGFKIEKKKKLWCYYIKCFSFKV